MLGQTLCLHARVVRNACSFPSPPAAVPMVHHDVSGPPPAFSAYSFRVRVSTSPHISRFKMQEAVPTVPRLWLPPPSQVAVLCNES